MKSINFYKTRPNRGLCRFIRNFLFCKPNKYAVVHECSISSEIQSPKKTQCFRIKQGFREPPVQAQLRSTVAPTPELEGQPVMINAKQVHDGCIEITDMDSPTCDVVTEIIRLTIFDARLHSTACHPDAEAASMVITPAIQPTLAVGCPTKFTSPDHQRIFQQPPLPEIRDQRRWPDQCRGTGYQGV